MKDGAKLAYNMYRRIYIIETETGINNVNDKPNSNKPSGENEDEKENENAVIVVPNIFSKYFSPSEVVPKSPNPVKKVKEDAIDAIRDIHGHVLLNSDEFHDVIINTCKAHAIDMMKPWFENIDQNNKWDYNQCKGLFKKAVSFYGGSNMVKFSGSPLLSFFDTLASMPVSQASVERLFHKLKRIRTPLRNRLSIESCDMNMYLYLNKYRDMYYTSRRPSAVADSDTDSEDNQ
jgi:hypothetical protein